MKLTYKEVNYLFKTIIKDRDCNKVSSRKFKMLNTLLDKIRKKHNEKYMSDKKEKDSKEDTGGYYNGSIHKQLEELRKCAVKLGSTINKEEIDPLIIMNIRDNVEYKPKDWKIPTQEEIQELLNQNKTTYWSTPNQQEKIKLQDGGWFDKEKSEYLGLIRHTDSFSDIFYKSKKGNTIVEVESHKKSIYRLATENDLKRMRDAFGIEM